MNQKAFCTHWNQKVFTEIQRFNRRETQARYRARRRWLALDNEWAEKPDERDELGRVLPFGRVLLLAGMCQWRQLRKCGDRSTTVVMQKMPRAAIRAARELLDAGLEQKQVIEALKAGPREVRRMLALKELGR